MAVADCYDAMNSRRIYRNALPPEVIYEEFRKNRGTQFDPKITDIFLKLLNEKRLPQWDPSQEEPDTYNLPDMQLTVSKFISDIMATIKNARKMQKAMISLPVFPCATWANVLPQNLCRRMMDV